MFKLKNKRDVLIKEFETCKELSKYLEITQQRIWQYLNRSNDVKYLDGYIITFEPIIIQESISNDVITVVEPQFDMVKIKAYLNRKENLTKKDIFIRKIKESKYPYKTLVEEYLLKDNKVTLDVIMDGVYDLNINNQSNHITVYRCFSYRQIIESIIEGRRRNKIMLELLNLTKKVLKNYN